MIFNKNIKEQVDAEWPVPLFVMQDLIVKLAFSEIGDIIMLY